jgi:damage-control phosphatase, subfamily I
MRTYLDCIPCLMNQALRAARLATGNEVKIKKVLDHVGLMIKDIPLESPPPETAMRVYRMAGKITGNPDPYRDLKNRDIRKALELYPVLKKEVSQSTDRLLTALRISIAGNVIDFGIDRNFDIKNKIEELLQLHLSVFDYDQFRSYLAATDKILYIGDNAGESVFDRILIEEINKPVTYVVRSAPIINDVTYTDAVMSGLDTVSTLMASGAETPGTVLERCTIEFKEKFYHSGCVISKGQGNFEALSEEKVPLFFLLIAKCPIVARDIGVEVGDMVLKGPNI